MEDQHTPDILEFEDGQLARSAEVVERNGQQAFPELARPAKAARSPSSATRLSRQPASSSTAARASCGSRSPASVPPATKQFR